MILDALISNNNSLNVSTVCTVEIGLLGGRSKGEGNEGPGSSLRKRYEGHSANYPTEEER